MKLLKDTLANPWTMLLVLTVLGTVAGLLAYCRDMSIPVHRIFVGTTFGFFVGAIYLVEIRLRFGLLTKRGIAAGIGLIAGGVLAALLECSLPGIAISVLMGALLGATGRNWIGQVGLP